MMLIFTFLTLRLGLLAKLWFNFQTNLPKPGNIELEMISDDGWGVLTEVVRLLCWWQSLDCPDKAEITCDDWDHDPGSPFYPVYITLVWRNPITLLPHLKPYNKVMGQYFIFEPSVGLMMVECEQVIGQFVTVIFISPRKSRKERKGKQNNQKIGWLEWGMSSLLTDRNNYTALQWRHKSKGKRLSESIQQLLLNMMREAGRRQARELLLETLETSNRNFRHNLSGVISLIYSIFHLST